MRIACDAQWWLALAMLDHCRPANWKNSAERNTAAARLSKICDEFSPKQEMEPA
jgi:hypothetical protein